MGFLVVRKESATKIHISEIHTLVVDSTAVSLTAALLNELIRQKVNVVFCDESHNPASQLLALRGSHDSSLKIKLQMNWPSSIKEQVWTELIAEKLRKQRELLLSWKEYEAAARLQTYLEELQPGDATNREGLAAKVYFNALFGMDFTRGEETVTNAALNYGYSLLLSVFSKEIVSNGYLTQLGLFHDNRFNPFNLASDLMEPFRPMVDALVVRAGFQTFEHSEKMEVLSLLQEEVLIGGRKQRLTNGVKQYCRSVFDTLNEQDLSKLQFYSYEL